jgi:septal ring factor EnvC (AmiA/AmiB activator)
MHYIRLTRQGHAPRYARTLRPSNKVSEREAKERKQSLSYKTKKGAFLMLGHWKELYPDAHIVRTLHARERQMRQLVRDLESKLGGALAQLYERQSILSERLMTVEGACERLDHERDRNIDGHGEIGRQIDNLKAKIDGLEIDRRRIERAIDQLQSAQTCSET